ncbi:hypothetical protein BJX99DRAFT_244047 [Aspergillus californicus]
MTVSHLVRRGVEVISTKMEDGDVPDFRKIEVGSPWLAGLLVITVFAFVFAIFSVDYTYGMLVPTLAAVESSNPELYYRVETDPANKAPGDPADLDMEVATAPPQPITSKLRTTIRHLRARAGRLSRFRGFSMFLLSCSARGLFTSFFPVSRTFVIGQFVIGLTTHILLANLDVAWVHIVISEPSPKRSYKRIPGFRSLKKIAPAAAFEHLLTNGVLYVALFIINHVQGLHELVELGPDANVSSGTYKAAFGLISIATLIQCFTAVPARAIFVRVAASMLPDEDEAIVPFDRSFGGKLVPEVVGGGVLSIRDAWTTFDRDGLTRYIKAVVKAFAMKVSVFLLFSMLITVTEYNSIFLLSLPFANESLQQTPPPLIAMATTAAGRMLSRQLQQMQSDKDIPGISCGLVDSNIFEWEVMLMISDDVKLYGGGFFRARLTFPSEYPHMPPKMKFESPLFHPNIYPNGDVCISILHPPEEDKYGYESAAERWSPVQTPETILLSVISMLSSPNDESPANVEAARLWREDPKEFKKRVRKCVRDSLGEE